MERRSYNSERKDYNNYGARGISICKEWRASVETFIEWALSNGWKQGLTIDRINNNGNYSPDNCRFVDTLTQNNNKRDNRRVSFKRKTQTIAEWGREFNINYGTLYTRLHKGWPIKRALTEPLRGKRS